MDLAPWRGDDGSADLGQFDGGRTQQAEPREIGFLVRGADVERHLHGADVRRINEDFRYRQPPFLGLVVGDDEARNADRLGGVIAAVQRRGTGVQRHRRGEDLEGRAHLVDAMGVAVEGGLHRPDAWIVGVEIRQRHHRQHLARMDVEHDPGGADGAKLRHRRLQFLAHDVLQTHVERKLERGRALAQGFVE